jgi:hypothetical protein
MASVDALPYFVNLGLVVVGAFSAGEMARVSHVFQPLARCATSYSR